MTGNETETPLTISVAGGRAALLQPGPQCPLRRSRTRRPSDYEDWTPVEVPVRALEQMLDKASQPRAA